MDISFDHPQYNTENTDTMHWGTDSLKKYRSTAIVASLTFLKVNFSAFDLKEIWY